VGLSPPPVRTLQFGTGAGAYWSPRVTLHGIGHVCATILRVAGKHSKYVQELLGHASISITLDTYSHVVEGMDGGLADAMDDAL
jgi:integrase